MKNIAIVFLLLFVSVAEANFTYEDFHQEVRENCHSVWFDQFHNTKGETVLVDNALITAQSIYQKNMNAFFEAAFFGVWKAERASVIAKWGGEYPSAAKQIRSETTQTGGTMRQSTMDLNDLLSKQQALGYIPDCPDMLVTSACIVSDMYHHELCGYKEFLNSLTSDIDESPYSQSVDPEKLETTTDRYRLQSDREFSIRLEIDRSQIAGDLALDLWLQFRQTYPVHLYAIVLYHQLDQQFKSWEKIWSMTRHFPDEFPFATSPN